jgi:hypothetical protein
LLGSGLGAALGAGDVSQGTTLSPGKKRKSKEEEEEEEKGGKDDDADDKGSKVCTLCV